MSRQAGPLSLRAIGVLAATCVSLVGCGATAPSGGGFSAAPLSSLPAASSAATAAPTARPRPTLPGDIAITTVVGGLVAPDGLVAAPDGSGRLFVLDQTGKVFIISRTARSCPSRSWTSAPRSWPCRPTTTSAGCSGWPSIRSSARTAASSSTTRPSCGRCAGRRMDHTDDVSSFKVSASDPNRVDPASEQTILQFEQPQANHNGGGLGFGPDGDLYIGVGDGGSEGDIGPGHSAGGNGQDTTKLNGKILRIDVIGERALHDPADNPFAAGGGRPEIYAYGLRNPWRFSWEPGWRASPPRATTSAGAATRRSMSSSTAATTAGRSARAATASTSTRRCRTWRPARRATKQGDPFDRPGLRVHAMPMSGSRSSAAAIYHGSGDPQPRRAATSSPTCPATGPATTPIGQGSVLAATPAHGSGPWTWAKLSIQGDPRPRLRRRASARTRPASCTC